MKPILLAALLASTGLAFAAEQNLTTPSTGAAGNLTPTGASHIGNYQQGQAYIQGTNQCEVSMWVDPSKIPSGGQQVTVRNCKQ
jgi:hypothetical protein